MRLLWWQESIWLTFTLHWSHILKKYLKHAENSSNLQLFTIMRYHYCTFLFYNIIKQCKELNLEILVWTWCIMHGGGSWIFRTCCNWTNGSFFTETKRNVNCEAKTLVNTIFFVLRIIKEVIVLFSIFISVYLFDNRERRGGDD